MGENISCLVYWSITRMKGEMSKISEDQREVRQRIWHFWNIIFQTFPYFWFPLFFNQKKKKKTPSKLFSASLPIHHSKLTDYPQKYKGIKVSFWVFSLKIIKLQSQMEVAQSYNNKYFTDKTDSFSILLSFFLKLTIGACVTSALISHIDVHPKSRGSRNAQNVQKWYRALCRYKTQIA